MRRPILAARVAAVAVISVSLLMLTGRAGQQAEPAPAPSTTTAPVPTTLPPTTTSSTTTTTTTTTTVPVAGGREAYQHPDWIALAVEVGWPNDPQVLATLDIVIQRESNGRPDAWNQSDPMTGSYGLTQVNGYWCSPTEYYPTGFMQVQGIGLTTCADLFDPVVNLRAALVIWTRQGDFGAWSTV